MGDFLNSPREKAAKNMYDQAMGGTTPFDSAIQKRALTAKTGLEAQGNRMSASMGGDILSQLTSAGITPGSSAAVGSVAKAKAGVGENVLQAEGQVDIAALDEQLKALTNFLNIGYSGLSSSSTLGDILAGLQTGANIFGGTATGIKAWRG